MHSVVLEDLCAIIGYSATRTVALWFSGRRLYVPWEVWPEHPLRTLLGDEPFVSLVRRAAGASFEIPLDLDDTNNLRRNRWIAERLAAGDSVAQIAGDSGLTKRRVEQIRRELAESGWLAYACAPGPKKWAARSPAPKLVDA